MSSQPRPKLAKVEEEDSPRPDLTKLLRALRGSTLVLLGIFILAAFYTLYFARGFFLPIILAVMLNFLLWPLVRSLRAYRIPEPVGAALVLLGLLATLGYGFYYLSTPASEWMAKAPQSLKRMERELRPLRQPVEKVNEAAKQVEELTEIDEGENQGATLTVERPSLSDTLFNGTLSMAASILVTLILLYFLLASGDFFLRKLLEVLPRWRDKRRVVEIARQIEDSISTYLFSISLINAGLGVAVGITMHFLGLPNPVLWGVMAALMNFIPYLGAIVGTLVLTTVAFITFSDWSWALLAAGSYLMLTSLEAYLITPILLGKRLTLNPVVIFVSLTLWGWLWGIPGVLLAVPILVTFKILCDHIEPLASIGEFLGSFNGKE